MKEILINLARHLLRCICTQFQAICSRQDVIIGNIEKVPSKKCLVILSYFRLWPPGLTKWLRIGYRCTLAHALQDLLVISFNLRPFKGVLGLKPIFELKIEFYFWSILDCNLSGWWNGLKFGADVLWQIPNNIQKWLFAIWSHFEVLLGLKPNFDVGKCIIFGDFLRFWAHWFTKWLENWHTYTLSYATQDLF